MISACLALGACAGASLETGSANKEKSSRPQAAATTYAASYIDFRQGAIDAAESKLKGLLEQADRVPGAAYIADETYKARAEYASGLAWAALERGDLLGAKRRFNEAIRKLATDEQEHVKLIREQDEKVQQAQTAIGIGLIGIATAIDARSIRAGSYNTSSNALSALQTSGVIQQLSKTVDSTDSLVRFVGRHGTDTDGVRMIVIPALNGPLSVIGRVRTEKGTVSSVCTGAMVGPRAVLSAAHCFSDRESGRRARESEVTFTIESPTHKRTAKVVAIHTPTPSWRPGDFDNDWAVLELDSNPAASQDFLIADHRFEPGRSGSAWAPRLAKSLYLAGYSSDLNDGRFLTMAAGCSYVRSHNRAQAIHRCPSWKGSSGAPVLVKHGKAGMESYHVVGVNVWGSGEVPGPDEVHGMRLITNDIAGLIRSINGASRN